MQKFHKQYISYERSVSPYLGMSEPIFSVSLGDGGIKYKIWGLGLGRLGQLSEEGIFVQSDGGIDKRKQSRKG